MVSKTQPAVPPPPPVHLETIYEETGSSPSSSMNDIHHRQVYHHGKQTISDTNQTVHGLISARSIPSVDVHRRRRIFEQKEKPPIEVRNRDGTKRFIHSNLPTTSMIVNRRKSSHSSRHDSSFSNTITTATRISPKYRQIWNTTPKKKKKLNKKPEIRLTIITTEDLNQAGITPPSTTSTDESETVTLTKSPTNKIVKDIPSTQIVEVPIESLSISTVPKSIHPVQPIVDTSLSNLHFPPASGHRSQYQATLRNPQQIPSIRSQSLPPSQAQLFLSTHEKSVSNQPPPVAVVPPSPKKTLPSLQITLTNDENDKDRSSQTRYTHIKLSSSKSSSETVNINEKQTFRPSGTILVGGGSRSAFRPFLKATNFNTQPRYSSQMNIKPHLTTDHFNSKYFQQQQQQQQHQQQQQQQQQHVPTYIQSYQPMPLSTTTAAARFILPPSMSTITNPMAHEHHSINSYTLKKKVQSNQIMSDKKSMTTATTTAAITTLTKPQQLLMNNHSSNISQEPLPDEKMPSLAVDPTLQWHSVTSKSLYDVPRLSNQYSDIPLRITIPEGTPTHNQKLLHQHDIALEKRLLEAGLSPETIALYERILEVANAPPIETISPPDIIDPYSHSPIL